jgi:hypothetical protein
MRLKTPLNIALGITTETLFALAIMLIALGICFIVT